MSCKSLRHLIIGWLLAISLHRVAMAGWAAGSGRLNLSSNWKANDKFQDFGRIAEDAARSGEAPSRRQCPSCYPPPGSAKPSERYLADMARLESIKRQILVKLGLQSKPNISASLPRDVILQTLIKAEAGFYSNSQETEMQHQQPLGDHETTDDDFYGKTSEIIAFAEQGPKLNGQILLEFSNSQENESVLRVKSAVLWIFVHLKKSAKRQRPPKPEKKPTLFIFQVSNNHIDNSTATNKNLPLELLSSDRVTLLRSGWIKMNLTSGIQNWFSSGHKTKLRLLIDCSGCEATAVEPVLTKGKSKLAKRRRRYRRSGKKHQRKAQSSRRKVLNTNTNRPFLVIHTDATNSRRLKRRVLDCSQTTRACCKQRFYVSFRALGWDDWIIAPSGYYANYCRGDCGGEHRTPDTFLNYHTHVMEEFRRLDSFPEIQPCCAPTKFSGMSLIYFGPDMNIIKRDLPKMVVEECGCP